MTNRSNARSRGDLLNSVATVRFALLPVLAGAAMALAGNTFTPTRAFAADVVCAPVASGTPLTGDTTCTGAGDKISFPSQTANATVTVNGVTITGAAAPEDAIEIIGSANNLTVNITGGGGVLGKGIGITTGTGGFALNVGGNVSSTGSNAIQTTGTTGTTGVNTSRSRAAPLPAPAPASGRRASV